MKTQSKKGPFSTFAEKLKEIRKRPPSGELIKKINEQAEKEDGTENPVEKKRKIARSSKDELGI